MTAMHGLQALAHGAVLSSFTRTARLLDGIEPGHKKTIEMTSGDPKEAMPGFVADNLAPIASRVFAADAHLTGVNILLGTYAFAFQIYGDFAGYSNIARGTSNGFFFSSSSISSSRSACAVFAFSDASISVFR